MRLPHRFADFNLRLKFVLPISLMLIISMLIVSGYLIRRQAEGFERELRTNGETMVKILALHAESGVIFESTYELNDLLGTLQLFGSVEYCQISTLEGNVLAHIGQQHIDAAYLAEMRKEFRATPTVESRPVTDNRDHGLIVISAPIVTAKREINREALGMTGGIDEAAASSATTAETIGWIELSLSDEKVKAATVDATIAVIVLATLVVLTAIMLVTFIVGAITKPVTELVEATDQISRGDFSRKVKIGQMDEIGHLASTFNRMIDSLKQSRDEIEQYNRTLEEKIIERTRQLDEAQAQLIQSEKMSAIGQLAAGVAHELNNPLGGILGYAQFTLEKLKKSQLADLPGKDIDSYIRYVSDIEIQARRCKTIVQNLLRFSRSSRTVEFEEVDINATIEETITFVEHQLRITEIEIEKNLDSRLPIMLGNASQLQQVFTNLIINSMHASEAGSSIEIMTRLSPALGEFGGAVEILVSDKGTGIPDENLKKIFEPFFTTKEVGKGTGLGLSVSYGIIKDHGGEITVHSTPGEGTTFTVVLPVQKSTRAADKPNQEAARQRD